MSLLVAFTRWFNWRMPFNRFKNRLARRAARKLAIADAPRVYGGVQGSLRMRLDLRSEAERWMFLNNYEVVAISVIRKVLRPGDVVVDVGANVGLLSLVAARRVGPNGHVYSFEPMPPTRDRFEENVRLNGADNITVIGKGCWDSPGHATIHEFEGLEISGASMGKLSGQTVKQGFALETVRVDDEIAAPVRLLKVDAEGAELFVLRGSQKVLTTCRPHILVELHPLTTSAFGYKPIEILDWLGEKLPDYQLRRLGRRTSVCCSRDEIARLLMDRPRKHQDIWLAPNNP